MVGSALMRRLARGGYSIIEGPAERVDLCDQTATLDLIRGLKPDWIFLAAAKVGGINANLTYPAEFIYTNLMIQTNVMHSAYLCGVKKLMVLGSSCIYPKFAARPIKEEALLSGRPEPTNEPYAVAKIAAIVMAQSYNKQYGTNFISVIPPNLYGANDSFHPEDSHVVAALLRKIHEAKVSGAAFVEVWGSGNPLREFLHVDDLADGCLFLMESYDSGEVINIGTGREISVRDLAYLTKEVVGYAGEIRFDPDMPDGAPRKILDVSRIMELGWKPSIGLREGVKATYAWYLENEARLRK